MCESNIYSVLLFATKHDRFDASIEFVDRSRVRDCLTKQHSFQVGFLDIYAKPLLSRAYTLPFKFGEKGQQFSLEIDTGSSDLVCQYHTLTATILTTSCSGLPLPPALHQVARKRKAGCMTRRIRGRQASISLSLTWSGKQRDRWYGTKCLLVVIRLRIKHLVCPCSLS